VLRGNQGQNREQRRSYHREQVNSARQQLYKVCTAEGVNMLKALMGLTGIGWLFISCCNATEYEDAVERAFRKAIVKIDVSTNTPVFKNDRNICVSEGTGFLIAARHIVTAAHVYQQLPPECGKPIILAKYKAEGLQLLATVVDARDDVSILKVDQDFPSTMCRLNFKENVFGTQAIRYGIPGGFTEPPTAEHIRIGEQVSEFLPLVAMTGTPTEGGESGGPVINLFNVVGMIHGKHERYVNFSFMTVGSTASALVVKNSIKISGRLCNPAEASIELIPPRQDFSGRGRFGLIRASLRLDEEFARIGGAATNDILDSFAKRFQAQSFVVERARFGNTVMAIREFNPSQRKDFDMLAEDAKQATAKAYAQLQEVLWAKYAADGNQSGKWNFANTSIVKYRLEETCEIFDGVKRACISRRVPYIEQGDGPQ